MRRAKIISKEKLYAGYLKCYKYALEIPALSFEKNHVRINQHEIVHSADSIHVLIYVPVMDSLVLCQEFRAGVFFNQNHDDPFILECVSGTIEQGSTPENTAIRETYEETGITVSHLKKIASVYKSPGLMTEKSYIYYAEVNEIPKTGLYGVEHEEIMTQLITRQEVFNLMDDLKIIDSATLLALNWFRANHG